MRKKYDEIVSEQSANTERGLTVITKVDENKLVPLINARNTQELVVAAQNFFPDYHVSTLAEANVATGKESKWLATVDEAFHALETMPQIRTLTEKKMSVLQHNRHPTASAKFHQSKLEQGVYTSQLLANQKDIKISKIQLEKMLYTYGKRKEQIENMIDKGEDSFIKEKNLELYKIKIMDLINNVVGLYKKNEILSQEIMEWSDIKADLYKEAQADGEVWSADEVDGELGYQEISLVLRHFQNFLIQVQQPDGSDISSVLNIQGLCLTAFQSGLKTNKLGLYMKSLSDTDIAILWKKLYNIDVGVARSDNFIIVKSVRQEYVFPTNLDTWKQMQEDLDKSV